MNVSWLSLINKMNVKLEKMFSNANMLRFEMSESCIEGEMLC